MIITIDGPAGTGKSSVALTVAEQLGFDFLDTGAMYRAIALEALRRNVSLEDSRELAFIAKHCRIAFDWTRKPPGLRLNDEPVGHLLRSGEVTRAASFIAVVPAIREQLVLEQQRIGASMENWSRKDAIKAPLFSPRPSSSFTWTPPPPSAPDAAPPNSAPAVKSWIMRNYSIRSWSATVVTLPVW